MKVYTHFIKIDENDGYRWRTLLQFGNSWDCIGSVVMKNPGSSKMVDSVPISNGNYSAPPMGMSNRLTVVLQQELH